MNLKHCGEENVKKLHNQPIIVNAWYILITASTPVATPLRLLTEIMLPEGFGSVLLGTHKEFKSRNPSCDLWPYFTIVFFYFLLFIFYISIYAFIYGAFYDVCS